MTKCAHFHENSCLKAFLIPDCSEEALELDPNGIGIYKPNINKPAGHDPIEIPILIQV